MAVLIAAGVRLRSDFDKLAPERDTDSDGWIGDTAHQQEVSDHNPDEAGSVPIHDADKINEVHAIDVDDDLRESDLTMEKVVQFLLARCRSGEERRLRYIIYNRRIWEASNGWKQRAYTGASPHTEHAHFSFSYETALESDSSSYEMELIPVALTSADKTWLSAEIDKAATKAAQRVWADTAERVGRLPGQTELATKGAIIEYMDANSRGDADRVIKAVEAAADKVIAAGNQ